MKTPENPSPTALDVTPVPLAESVADDGGLGQLPIAISDGDFSTPVRRTRTITRPRGLRTLEPPTTSPGVPSHGSVHRGGKAAEGSALPEGANLVEAAEVAEIAELTEIVEIAEPGALELGGSSTDGDLSHPPLPDSSLGRPADIARLEPSAVDEFLAAPPTPNPEMLKETPIPEPGSLVLDGAAGFPEPNLAIVENLDLAAGFRQSALRRDAPASDGLVTPSVPPRTGGSDQLRWEIPAGAGAEATVSEPQDAETVEIVAASAHEFGSLDGLAPHHSYGNTPQVSPRDSETELAKVEAESAAHETGLSPLAQALANMAEDMHSDTAIEHTIDIDIADAPLVSLQRDTAPPPPTQASSRAAPPPVPPPVTVPSAQADAASARVARPPTAPLTAVLPEALAERPRRPKRSKPWFEEVFDESYLRTLPFMTAEQTLQEVDFIEASLGVPKGSEVLDVGCGYGRHAIELVQRGLNVTGLDLSLPLLIRAADESQRRSVSVNFVHADMREMAFEHQFSGAYCMLTSFGYFDEESNVKVAELVAKALKPGGRFLIDAINRDYVVGDLPARIWWEGDGCVVLEEVDFNFNTNRVVTHRSIVFEDGQQLDHEISIRVYSLHELGKLLRQAGFRVLEVSGSISTKGHFFGANSRNLLILAERRSD